jgi:hypothetical protein
LDVNREIFTGCRNGDKRDRNRAREKMFPFHDLSVTPPANVFNDFEDFSGNNCRVTQMHSIVPLAFSLEVISGTWQFFDRATLLITPSRGLNSANIRNMPNPEMSRRELLHAAGTAAVAARLPGVGLAGALECARILAARPHRRTLMFVAFTGEEQGRLGSTALVKRAKSEGWALDAVLNNDMIGNAVSARGERQNRAVRIFSEDVPEHRSRELARWKEWHQRQRDPRHRVKLVFRRDRFGRGGDHTPFNQQGFTGVRVVEVHEDYRHQHTDQDLPKFMDWGYLARNTALNLHALHALANAEAAPRRVRVDRAQSYDSTITWEGDANQTYVVYWRETASPVWQGARQVRGLRHVDPTHHKDDHTFAVGAIGGIPVVAE